MGATALVWFRRNLRVHDHPPLHAALDAYEQVVPVFVLDERLLAIPVQSPSREQFLLECLRELRVALRARGGELVLRTGPPELELPALALETGAEAVYFSTDTAPFARGRDRTVERALLDAGVNVHATEGNYVVDVARLQTQTGGPFADFASFWEVWDTFERREVHDAPRTVPVPYGLPVEVIRTVTGEVPDPLPAGEKAGRRRMHAWLRSGVNRYHERHDLLAGGTSMLSPYVHLGCVSPRELEARAAERGGPGADAYRRRLAWRDFRAHVQLHNAGEVLSPHQRALDAIGWTGGEEDLAAWTEGRTGFPIVDAAMRQLATIGWMHNRARLIAASFLAKELQVDWRRGEAHFMRLLLGGETALDGWVSSVVLAAPLPRRFDNPILQQRRHDPDGVYVRRWLPELAKVPLERLAEPWTMTAAEQEEAGCVIGREYPWPIVTHARQRGIGAPVDRAAGI